VNDSHERFGTDLRLLGDLLQGHSRQGGEDLKTRSGGGGVDLATVSGVENLQQALLLRFLTPKGDLARLGHPRYGSRLFELVGELNTETQRNRAKLFVLEALAAEPRVDEVLRVDVTTDRRRDPARLDIAVSLRAVEVDTPINLVFPFFLEAPASASTP
jgi:phage baseplate assembly protein W